MAGFDSAVVTKSISHAMSGRVWDDPNVQRTRRSVRAPKCAMAHPANRP